jgi:hypothetical protein
MDDDKAGMYVEPPSGSFSSWENTRCNPLGDMRTQTQNAWHDGYASAKVEQEWVGLTDEEMFDCLAQTDGEAKRLPLGFKWFARAIEAKLKEKNAQASEV